MRGRMPPTCEWARQCCGMDDQAAGPVFVQASRRGSRVAIARVPAPAGDLPLAAGLTGREAWVRRLEAPLPSRRKMLDVMPGLLDVQLPLGIEECVVVYTGLAPRPGGWAAAAAVARRTDVRARLDQWSSQGREPQVLDQEGLALWTQALREFPPAGAGERRAVVYWGDDRAAIAFGRGDELLAAHGLRHFEPEPALRLARLAFEGKTDGIVWIWTGPGAVPGNLERVRPGMGAGGTWKETAAEDPATFLARAYAIRALLPGPLRCDLRQGDLAHPAIVRLRRARRSGLAAAWLAAGLILLAGGLAWNGAIRARQAQARQAVTERAARVTAALGKRPVLQAGYELRAVSNAMAAAAPACEPFQRALEPPRGQSLGRLLIAAREAGAVLHRLEWNDERLRLEGRVATEAKAAGLARLVERETGWPVSVKPDRKADDEFHFTLEAARGR